MRSRASGAGSGTSLACKRAEDADTRERGGAWGQGIVETVHGRCGAVSTGGRVVLLDSLVCAECGLACACALLGPRV